MKFIGSIDYGYCSHYLTELPLHVGQSHLFTGIGFFAVYLKNVLKAQQELRLTVKYHLRLVEMEESMEVDFSMVKEVEMVVVEMVVVEAKMKDRLADWANAPDQISYMYQTLIFSYVISPLPLGERTKAYHWSSYRLLYCCYNKKASLFVVLLIHCDITAENILF